MSRREQTTATWSIWPAPAKLNLFLRLTGQRADGYHLLQTCFQLLDWGDRVRLRMPHDGAIRRIDAIAGVPEAVDLTLRAARRLREATGSASGVEIAVDKCIPMGGGLGGGSSDAATVLVALNALWDTRLDPDALAELGLDLGADVPVFVHGRSAFAEGVGERLTPLDLPERWYVVADPGAVVPTRELFRAPELTRNARPLTISRFVSGAATENAFEPVVRARYPAVARALDWLSCHGSAHLSGSGGCVFLPVASVAAGETVIAGAPPGVKAWLARGVNVSPLHEALADWMRRQH